MASVTPEEAYLIAAVDCEGYVVEAVALNRESAVRTCREMNIARGVTDEEELADPQDAALRFQVYTSRLVA